MYNYYKFYMFNMPFDVYCTVEHLPLSRAVMFVIEDVKLHFVCVPRVFFRGWGGFCFVTVHSFS